MRGQMMRCGALVFGLPAVLGAFGCVHDANSRNVLGAQVSLAAIDAEADAVDLGEGNRTTSVDRSAWTPVRFVVPVDGTVHGPTWRTFSVRPAGELARERGVYPTALTATELGGECGPMVTAAVLSPFVSLVDVAAMPVRMVTDPAWEERQSPDRWYERSRHGMWIEVTAGGGAGDGAGGGAGDVP